MRHHCYDGCDGRSDAADLKEKLEHKEKIFPLELQILISMVSTTHSCGSSEQLLLCKVLVWVKNCYKLRWIIVIKRGIHISRSGQ